MLSWEKEYEHFRDKGHTWGPGVDDAISLNEAEEARQDALTNAYQNKLKEYSVAPRNEFLEAGKILKEIPHSCDNWREEYNKKKIDFCSNACKSLGYSLKLDGFYNYIQNNEIENTFSISVEYYGWLPDRGGNIHRYFVCGIKDVEDCLQLVADFGAIGAESTTWYGKDFHYSTLNTGELRYELIRLCGVGKPVGRSLDETLESATERSVESDNIALAKADMEKE